MEQFGILIMALAIFLATLPKIRRQWIEDRAGTIKTLKLLVLYFLYAIFGIISLLFLIPSAGTSEAKALALTGAFVVFLFYGLLILMRLVPRYREPPAWLMRFGILDIALLCLLFSLLVAYLWV